MLHAASAHDAPTYLYVWYYTTWPAPTHHDHHRPPQEGSVFRGTFDFLSAPFDWGAGYRKPNIPLKDLVIAELPVRLFTGGLGWGGAMLQCWEVVGKCPPRWRGDWRSVLTVLP